jgi:hypothetical protein
MSEEQINIPQMQMAPNPAEMQVGQVNPESSSTSLWMWMFIMFLFGLFILGVYYFFLYFYDAYSMEDAIEKAFKRFNETPQTEREEVGITGDTGATEEQVTFKNVLTKALDNAVSTEDENEKEGFQAMGSSDSSLGKLNWCLLDEHNNGSGQIVDSNMCMSGNIFPSRDICINPTLRTL